MGTRVRERVEQRTGLHVIKCQINISIVLCFDDMLKTNDILMASERLERREQLVKKIVRAEQQHRDS
jgi:hypothetical protein